MCTALGIETQEEGVTSGYFLPPRKTTKVRGLGELRAGKGAAEQGHCWSHERLKTRSLEPRDGLEVVRDMWRDHPPHFGEDNGLKERKQEDGKAYKEAVVSIWQQGVSLK